MAIDTSAFDRLKGQLSGATKKINLGAFGGGEVEIQPQPRRLPPPQQTGLIKEMAGRAIPAVGGAIKSYVEREEAKRSTMSFAEKFKYDIIQKPASIVKFIAQGAASAPVAIGRSVQEVLGAKSADTKFDKTLFGGPVETYQQITKHIDDYVKKSPYATNAEKTFLAPVMGLALFAADAFPGKPGLKKQAKNLFEEIAKDIDPSSIEKKLVDFGVDESNAKRIAPKLVETKTPQAVKQSLLDDASDEVAKFADMVDETPQTVTPPTPKQEIPEVVTKAQTYTTPQEFVNDFRNIELSPAAKQELSDRIISENQLTDIEKMTTEDKLPYIEKTLTDIWNEVNQPESVTSTPTQMVPETAASTPKLPTPETPIVPRGTPAQPIVMQQSRIPEGASGVVDDTEIPQLRDILKRDQVSLKPTRARGAMDIKGRDLRKEMEANITRYNEKIPDAEIRTLREQNLLKPETIDEIILRKRGIITDAEAVERAKKIQGTLNEVIDLPKGTVLTKEQYTAVEQIVQNEREINKALKEALDSGSATGGAAERKLLKELGEEYTKMSDQELLRHAYQESTVNLRKAEIVLMGARSEAGRALQATKQYVEGVDQRLRILFNRLNSNKKLDEFEKQAIVDTITRMDLTDNKKFLKELDKLVKPDFFDKLAEYSVAVKLFNPTTHIVNFGGNSVRQLLDIGIKTVTNPMAAKADMMGAAHGLKIGLKNGLKALGNEGYAQTLAKWVETGGQGPAIGGVVGQAVRLPFRALGASDEIFRNTAFHRKMYREAYSIAKKEGLKGKQVDARMQELLNTPTFDMVDKANAEAKRMTFQEDMGEIVKKINRMRDPSTFKSIPGKTMATTIRAFVPFLNTPTNLFKQAVDFSPLGIAKNFKALKKAAKEGNHEKVGTILGEALVGSALAAYIAMETMDGNITGGVPTNPADKDRFYREKKLPYAIKIGDRWYQYQRLDPLALIMGMTADLTNGEELSLGSVVSTVTENLKDKTYLSGVSDLMKLLTGEDWEREYSFKSMILGMTTPSFVGHIARSMDPNVRVADTIGERLVAQTPGLSEELPSRVNVLGYDVERANKGLNYFFNPIQSASAKVDPVTKELSKIDKSISVPSKTFERNKVKYELTPREYEDFARYTGTKLRSDLMKLFKTPKYQNADDDKKEAMIDTLRDEIMNEWKNEYVAEQTGDAAKRKRILEIMTGEKDSTAEQIKSYFLGK